MKTKKLLICFASLFIISSLIPTSAGSENHPRAELTDMGEYYHAELYYSGGTMSPRQMGEALGEEIKRDIPHYERLVDKFLKELIISACEREKVSKEIIYGRVAAIKNKLDKAYRDEIEGLASNFSGEKKIILGDSRISVDEVYLLNLLPDVIGGPNGDLIAVTGRLSSTRKTQFAAAFGWQKYEETAKLFGITDIYQGEKSISLIGIIGVITAYCGYNERGLFGALLNADPVPYPRWSISGYYSCAGDLRHALENSRSAKDAANYLKPQSRRYAIQHNMFLADPDVIGIFKKYADGRDPGIFKVKNPRLVMTSHPREMPVASNDSSPKDDDEILDGQSLKKLLVDLSTDDYRNSQVLMVFNIKDMLLDVDWGNRAVLKAFGSLKNDTTVTRVALVNNTNSTKTFTLSGGRPVTLAPGQKHMWRDPLFAPDNTSSISCKETGDKAILFWEKMALRKDPYYIRFEQPGNEILYNFAAYDVALKYHWETKGIYHFGPSTTYITYWINDHGNVWAWGQLTFGGGAVAYKCREKQPDPRKGIIVYYGNDRPLPDPANVVVE